MALKSRLEGERQKKEDLPRLHQKSCHISRKPVHFRKMEASQEKHPQKDGPGPPEDPLLPRQSSPQDSQNKDTH